MIPFRQHLQSLASEISPSTKSGFIQCKMPDTLEDVETIRLYGSHEDHLGASEPFKRANIMNSRRAPGSTQTGVQNENRGCWFKET